MAEYTPKNIDIDAFEKALMKSRELEQRRLSSAREKAQAYYDGFDACVDEVVSMLHCANYEKREASGNVEQ